MKRSFRPLVLACALLAGCSSGSTSTATQAPAVQATPVQTATLRGPLIPVVPTLTLSSTNFANGAPLPPNSAQNGCGGTNQSPQISWSAGPAGTQSYVLTVFDPDAPTGVGFWHWTLYNIPPNTTSLFSGFGSAPTAGTSGLSDYGTLGYGGPCPPVGDIVHHYIFTVYALNTVLTGMPPQTSGAYLIFSLRSNVIAMGTYIGTYQR